MKKDQIQEWLDQGIITKDQAVKMRTDVETKSKEDSSNQFIAAISIIGALLLGIGSITFVAANWDVLSNALKASMLITLTFGSMIIGYMLVSRKNSFPKSGNALIFLSTVLFGATIFLIAQMYNIQANAHWLVLLWIAGILPIAYLFASPAIITLAASLVYIWVPTFLFSFDAIEFSPELFPTLFIALSLSLFGLGGLHYHKDFFKPMARPLRLIGVQIALLTLYLPTIGFFYDIPYNKVNSLSLANPMFLLTIALVLIATILLLMNVFQNPAKRDTNMIEHVLALTILIFSFVFSLFPSTSILYQFGFNFLFASISIVLLYIGYNSKDMKLVNIGSGGLGLYIVTKYFDFFWDLLPRSFLFMAGGIILIAGGIFLEQKRRKLKASFVKSE